MAVTTLMAELVFLYDDHGLGLPLCLCTVYAATVMDDYAVYLNEGVLPPVHFIDALLTYFEDRGHVRCQRIRLGHGLPNPQVFPAGGSEVSGISVASQ